MERESIPVLFDEMAKHCPTSKAWLRRQVLNGKIPHIKAGRRRLFNVAAVKAALADMAARGDEDGGVE